MKIMKKLSFLILSIIIACGCSQRNSNISLAGIEVIPVEVNNVAQDVSSFIEKIEITPLETNDSSLIHKVKKVIYDKKTDMYAMYTSDQIVFTFKGNGEYIANSKKMQGPGPEEYGMVLDISFNPYLGGIDMLSPYGTIYTYSSTFELLAKRKYTPEFPINHLMPLDSVNYIFTHPVMWTDQELSFVDINSQQVVMDKYGGTVSSGHYAEHHCFYQIGEHFYYIPLDLNYYIYQIDPVEKKLTPVIYLDFGEEEVKEKGLPGRAVGKRTLDNKELDAIVEGTQERMQYVRNSEYLLPLVKFISEDYIYLYCKKGQGESRRIFLYNRKKKESFLLTERKPLLIPPCKGLVDNVLFLLFPPELDLISQIVDRKLMSAEEISKMEALNEDDNPVIVKYYLKK